MYNNMTVIIAQTPIPGTKKPVHYTGRRSLIELMTESQDEFRPKEILLQPKHHLPVHGTAELLAEMLGANSRRLRIPSNLEVVRL